MNNPEVAKKVFATSETNQAIIAKVIRRIQKEGLPEPKDLEEQAAVFDRYLAEEPVSRQQRRQMERLFRKAQKAVFKRKQQHGQA